MTPEELQNAIEELECVGEGRAAEEAGPQPTPPTVWWSPSSTDSWSKGLIVQYGKGLYLDSDTSETTWIRLDALPADAVRLVGDDPVETAWEAATGEIEELRRQLNQRDADLARVTQERDQARAASVRWKHSSEGWQATVGVLIEEADQLRSTLNKTRAGAGIEYGRYEDEIQRLRAQITVAGPEVPDAG